MSDILSETEGCDLLARLFKKRGYTVMRNLTFREYGVSFHIDGWDAKKRVGFEFLTSEDDDHDDLTLAEYQTLMAAQQRGELSLFILDEVEPLSVGDLTDMANDFLDEVEAAAKPPRKAAATRGAAKKKEVAGKLPAKKPAAKKKSARKLSAKKVSGTKAVRRKR